MSTNYIKEIADCLIEATCDQRSVAFLAQGISLCFQRGNAACILGMLPRGNGLGEELDYL